MQAVLGDNRLLLDPNAISGDKIHGGNISQFASSAIADNTNWSRNDPSIEAVTLEDGYDGSGVTTVHNDDQALWNSVETITGSAGSYEMTITDESNPLTRRRAGYAEVAFEREQTLNQILTNMDGFEQSDSIVVLAATNRVDILDSALTRSGRFDRKVQVGLPDTSGRRKILDVHLRNKFVEPSTDLDEIAALTGGF